MQPYLALITPLSGDGGRPDQGLPGAPPGVWGPGSPIISNPIAPGGTTPPWGISIPGQPPGIWGPNSPIIGNPIVIPPSSGQPPGIWIPIFPTNPIAPGGTTPPWGISSDRPDQGLPVPPADIGNLPPPPGELAQKVVVAVYKPGEGWSAKAYDPNARPDQGLPPYAQPKG
jgi:hypothetical protein